MKRLALILLALAACTSKPEKPSLYILTHATGIEDAKDSTWQYTGEYFETSLSEYSSRDGSGQFNLKAKTKKQDSKPGEYFITTWQSVSDSLGNEMIFPSNTDFLNYMSARGFEMVDQKKRGEYGTDYTFKMTSDDK